MQAGEMVKELRAWGQKVTVRHRADARPFQAPPLVPFLLVVGDLPAASILAGDENVVHNAFHAIAALRSSAFAFWELVMASRADEIPLGALKEAKQIFS